MLTYSTCTAFKDENEQVVDRFLKMKTGESFVVESTMAVKLGFPGEAKEAFLAEVY